MKFMSSFQCLMGGNVVQYSSSPSSSPSSSSVSPHVDDCKKKVKRKTKKRKDRKVIKVFKPDGEINLYHKPIMVSEVMTDECMVCRSDSFYIGQKIPPLSEHDRLLPGHTYFLLPAHLFHSVLSFVTIASFTSPSTCNSKEQQQQPGSGSDKMKAAFLKKAAASSCSPFDIQKTASGSLKIRVSELFLSQLMMDQATDGSSSNQGGQMNLEAASASLLCTTPQLHREYKQLVVGSRRSWKPKLEMIKETSQVKCNKRKQVKMLLSASINRMKTKMKKKPQTTSSPSCSLKKRKKKKLKNKTPKSHITP